jgi:hypothetical protein
MACPSPLSRARHCHISVRISGGESFCRLVEDEQFGIGQQRAANRKHLLLAAGELIAHVSAPLGQRGEELVDARERPAVAAGAGDRGGNQILFH